MTAVIFAAVVVLAAGFAFLNGFRDASTSVALAVRTRALTPSVAVLLAAFFNFLGALLSASLAVTISQTWISLPDGTNGLSMLVAGLASACVWGVLLWWRGIPASSTHALVGGLGGAGLASLAVGGAGVGAVNESLLFQVVLPLLLSPLVAYSGAFLLVFPVTWAARYTQPNVVNQRFRRSQSIAAGAVAFGHGLQDGQRISAVLLLALLAAGYSDGGTIPMWVALLSAVMITVGTLFGGWRISQTIGYKITRIDPLRGSVAQIFSAVILFVGAIGLHWPVSTTHIVTSAVLGAGENQNFSVTNRKLVIRILGLWVLTPAATAAGAFVLALAMSPLAG
ncbi:inorganic phosphate transporter [Pseudarthrobacter raffinosi]|uniref:inorganic phosphate transporter n=1 Tax=Pseudarthrobacter raffinosi TaxID=2953651 RepID=UPI00208F070E|nr:MULTISPECIES: inorganic phosphate transporter [unclassified Pseudarthrobacter]MCO4239163.1 inorganic phosphate transporter [Pseudarthrobacter sp. MDT3-28]MCO4253466.1 inorganic phosphate transporter [Pseudarthrobacter sp. MDT3-9]MCO4263987.1 inorganic phosphate transporter [Pseudarthrobacter sp. MDT3-26]